MTIPQVIFIIRWIMCCNKQKTIGKLTKKPRKQAKQLQIKRKQHYSKVNLWFLLYFESGNSFVYECYTFREIHTRTNRVRILFSTVMWEVRFYIPITITINSCFYQNGFYLANLVELVAKICLLLRVLRMTIREMHFVCKVGG